MKRIAVCITDDFGRCLHGVMLAPPAVTTTDRAKRLVGQAFSAVTAANPDEWDFDDVLDALVADGWDRLDSTRWDEDHDA